MNEYMTEMRWSLDDMLQKAKQNPMTICHDYDTRFRVWTNSILRNRYQNIIKSGGNPDYISRMNKLVIDDHDRLIEQARKEFKIDNDINKYHERCFKLFSITTETIKLYIFNKNNEGEIND